MQVEEEPHVDLVKFLTAQKTTLRSLFTADDAPSFVHLSESSDLSKFKPWLTQLFHTTFAYHSDHSRVDYCGEARSVLSRLASFDEVVNRNQDLYDCLDRVTTELEDLKASQESARVA